MLVVKFQGGIGNQLFEYAFYKELQYLGKTVYADLSEYRVKHQVRELELSKLGLHVEEAPRTVLRKLGHLHDSVYDKMMFRIKGKKNTVRDEYGQVFNPKYFEEDNVLLDGYWQTKKYFSDVFDEVVSEIDFGSGLDLENRAIADEMKKRESVSIHMRFGDYVGHKLYSGICTAEYYKKAIACIKKHVISPEFYVITDDEEAASKVLEDEDYTVLRNNRGSDSYKDMYLISSCKHHIMANSSFSWWGVMLDKKKDGVVISPNKWLNGIDDSDIWEEEWIRMP